MVSEVGANDSDAEYRAVWLLASFAAWATAALLLTLRRLFVAASPSRALMPHASVPIPDSKREDMTRILLEERDARTLREIIEEMDSVSE